ncbi:uncharacterized protein [Ptychodera flava]|uniref:uncharacterized protein n=1 Tax=Ptychodera flava TaxID=63121 RepID=UPI003969F785
MKICRALSVWLVLALSTSVRTQNVLETEGRLCSYTLTESLDDGRCPPLRQILSDHEKRIAALEEELQAIRRECPCNPNVDDPLTPLDQILADHVIAHYNFEGNVKDISGNDHHGNAIGGVTYVSGEVSGQAASFNGNQKINVDSLRNFNWGSSFSVSLWFKRTGEWSNYQGIVSNGYHSTGSWEIRMGREMSGQMLGGGVNTANSPQTWNYVNLLAQQNTWHHVVMTYDGETLNYYLDNKKQAGDQTCCHGDMLIKDTPLTIGQAGVGKSNEYFYGLVDEVVIFNKVLSPDDVRVIFDAQNPNECADPSLIAYFPFDDSYNDESCHGRPGAAVGGVTISGADGISGNSAFFAGNGKVDVALLGGYRWGSQFTVSVWFKRTGGWGSYQGIVSNGYHSHGSWEIRMGRENSGQMLGGGVVTSDSARTWDYVHLTASQNQWHHVAMVYDGSHLKFYLDNVEQDGAASCCHGDMIPRDNPLTIGKSGAGMNGEYFYGYIDEVKIFSRALSESEVAQIYLSFAR